MNIQQHQLLKKHKQLTQEGKEDEAKQVLQELTKLLTTHG